MTRESWAPLTSHSFVCHLGSHILADDCDPFTLWSFKSAETSNAIMSMSDLHGNPWVENHDLGPESHETCWPTVELSSCKPTEVLHSALAPGSGSWDESSFTTFQSPYPPLQLLEPTKISSAIRIRLSAYVMRLEQTFHPEPIVQAYRTNLRTSVQERNKTLNRAHFKHPRFTPIIWSPPRRRTKFDHKSAPSERNT